LMEISVKFRQTMKQVTQYLIWVLKMLRGSLSSVKISMLEVLYSH
jgi:hypothetical protein